jgi:DNA-binding beta-propeller fold protein YncE
MQFSRMLSFFPFGWVRVALALFAGCLLGLSQGCSGGSAAGTSTAPTSPATPTVTATSTTYSTLGAPYEAVSSSSGAVFVSVTADGSAGSETGVQVFTTAAGGGLQSSCVDELPASLLAENAAMGNLDFLPKGTDIGGGIGSPGAIFYNAAALQSCTASGFVVSQGPISANELTLEALVTPDEKYAFVINQDGVAAGAIFEGNVGVVQLQLDANGNVTTGTTLLGQISTGGAAIAGIALSADGTRLYLTTGVAGANTAASGGNNPVLARTGCPNEVTGGTSINGLLTVIDVAQAETNPGAGAILANVDAGCNPVRIVESANESVLWVTARGDDRVLAFSPSLLESNPNNALLGYAASGGTAPVGLRLFDNDELLAVANSNRFNTGIANATILYVADPATASVIQTISTGLFPREITVGSDDATLYLTNYDSDTLQVIKTTVN